MKFLVYNLTLKAIIMNDFSKHVGSFIIIFSLIFSACRTEPVEQTSTGSTIVSVSDFETTGYHIDSITGTTVMQIPTANGYAIVDSGMGTCVFNSNTFRLQLPNQINLSRLQALNLKSNGNIFVSDSLVKISSPVSFSAFNKGKYCGKFVLTNVTQQQYSKMEDNNYTEVLYLYVDRPVEIRGNYSFSENEVCYNQTFNLIFKSGWNTLTYNYNKVNNSNIDINYISNDIPQDTKWIYIDNQLNTKNRINLRRSINLNLK